MILLEKEEKERTLLINRKLIIVKLDTLETPLQWNS